MSSTFFINPYELGEKKGEIKGKLEGILEGKTDILIKQLSRRFGLLSVELQKKIGEADQYQLDLIAESIFDFKSADDTLKYLQ